MHYRDAGDSKLPLLVLLHGFGDSFTSWEGWVPELQKQFHVISLDFPPATAKKFTAAISGAKLITYPNVGHLPQIEIPQRSAADVAAFLKAYRSVGRRPD